MLQDVEARRPTEVDYLNGGIARFGRELGVPTPSQRGDLGARERVGGVVDEMTRRYSNVARALARDGLDAAIVCGSEYTASRER
jgi:hypothetical protein